MENNGFGCLNLSSQVLADLEYHGLTSPMPIQEQAIPILMQGKDLIAQAKTGTGKTLAFAIPIIEKVDVNKRNVQALILTPTRELAEQVSGEIRKVGYQKKVSVGSFYGGKSINAQARQLQDGVQVIVGTPGRILDLISRRLLRLDCVETFVLDEADRMLDMGFIDDIRRVISYLPEQRQTMLFSATIPENLRSLVGRMMCEPEFISTSSDTEELTVTDVDQSYYETSKADKFDAFVEVLRNESPESAIIFCNT
ncbi:MAG: DEAD/DEAH box helicase, partial [Candidatus Altiarchaeota archaeon]|nr:DEAD/DEAH box helicase [Candidatus Altiarchaeota archaeon]